MEIQTKPEILARWTAETSGQEVFGDLYYVNDKHNEVNFYNSEDNTNLLGEGEP